MSKICQILILILLVGKSVPCQPVSSDSVFTTEWSKNTNGLQMRIITKPALDLGEKIEIRVELDVSPEMDSIRINWLARGSYITINLLSTDGGFDRVFKIEKPLESIAAASDDSLIVLPGGTISKISCLFDPDTIIDNYEIIKLAKHYRRSIEYTDPIKYYHTLAAGSYTAEVMLFSPKTSDTVWSGMLISPKFGIMVGDKENLYSSETFYFSNKLKAYPGPVYAADSNSLQPITVKYRKGNLTQYAIKGPSANVSIIGLPRIPEILFNEEIANTLAGSSFIIMPESLTAFVDGYSELQYNFTLQETVLNLAERCRYPRTIAGETLWEDSVKIELDTKGFDRMYNAVGDLFDYYAILVPHKVWLKDGVEIYQKNEDMMAREVRIGKGHRFLTGIMIDGQWMELKEGLPDSVLWRMPERLPSNSQLDFELDIFEYDDSYDYKAISDSVLNQFKLWSGDFIIPNVGLEFDIRNEFSVDIPQKMELRRYNMPRHLFITDDLELMYDTTNQFVVDVYKKPDGVIMASLYSGEDAMTFSTDLMNPLATLKYPRLIGDSVKCVLRLYEFPYDGTRFYLYNGKTLWESEYKIPVTKKQIKKIEKSIKNKPVKPSPPRW